MADEADVRVESGSDSRSHNDYAELTEAVQSLVEVMHKGQIERLELSRGDLHILLCARPASTLHAQPTMETSAERASPDKSQTQETAAETPIWHQITSPMVGTYYEAASPGEAPFVRPGDTVEVGQIVAIIEAMKIMNEIVADRPGVIDAVLVENGETVEFGHPLFRMRPA